MFLGEATRLGYESVEPWLDLVRLRALADPEPARVWSEIDTVSSRFGAQATLALRMRLSFTLRDPARAAQAAREISDNRTGAIWESSLPELEAQLRGRIEWCAVNPVNGEIYYTLTNNSNRKISPTGAASGTRCSSSP